MSGMQIFVKTLTGKTITLVSALYTELCAAHAQARGACTSCSRPRTDGARTPVMIFNSYLGNW